MADPAPRDFILDPMALWRDAVAQWEKGVNDVTGQTLGSAEFAKGMHGAMGSSLAAQKTFAELMGRYLTALNLPSRAEVGELGERLSQIESRLIRMNTLLEHLVDPEAAGVAKAAVAKVPRTRRPPSLPVVREPVEAPARSKRGA